MTHTKGNSTLEDVCLHVGGGGGGGGGGGVGVGVGVGMGVGVGVGVGGVGLGGGLQRSFIKISRPGTGIQPCYSELFTLEHSIKGIIHATMVCSLRYHSYAH